MKKYFLLSAFSVLFGFSAFAKQVDEETAMRVAKNFYTEKAVQNLKINTRNIELNYYSSTGFNGGHGQSAGNLYFIFNVNENNGFVIVSADDVVQPILAYSNEGSFSEAEMPPAVQFWMDGYKEQIQYAIEHNLKADESVTSKWNELLSPQPHSTSKNSSSVSPLLTTKWDQGGYYNDLCPGGAVTGCVATTMAQIMKFWNYPENGTGSKTYIDATFGAQTADFAHANYNWAGMPNSVNSANINVATLMFHCGVSVSMHYGTSASGASVILADGGVCAEYAFYSYFGYDPWTIKGQRRSTCPDWHGMLKNELDNSRPVQYVGRGNDGHTWVCDGYDASSLYHMNWGWGGYADGYYSVDDLTPGGSSFNNNQQALVGIQPMNFATRLSTELASSISLAPNPANTFIDLNYSAGNTLNHVRIVNVNGQVISGMENVPSFTRIDVSEFAAGIYYLEAIGEDKKYSAKFVVID